jgi:hypothetical protein
MDKDIIQSPPQSKFEYQNFFLLRIHNYSMSCRFSVLLFSFILAHYPVQDQGALSDQNTPDISQSAEFGWFRKWSLKKTVIAIAAKKLLP